MTDAFYTPEPVAAAIADVLLNSRARAGTAADFAIGGGALLDELGRRDPDSHYFGTDIDHRVVRRLRDQRPKWRVGRCDFLDDMSRRRCAITRKVPVFDAIALNPPFSGRGGTKRTIKLDGKTFSGSPAASFVGLATSFAHEETRIAALLPRASLSSEKDADLWAHLRRRWRISVEEEFGPGWIEGSKNAVVLTALEPLSVGESIAAQRGLPSRAEQHEIGITLIRGTLQMHKVRRKAGGLPMIHTTGLSRNGPTFFASAPARARRTVGPSVLLPRVGMPSPWKVQIYRGKNPIVLSDCVISLECATVFQAGAVCSRIHENWSQFKQAWNGSCAPYVTVSRLCKFLAALGVNAEVVST